MMKKLENHALANLMSAAALILLLLAGCGGGVEAPRGEPTVASRAGNFELRLWLDPDPPKQEGWLWVELRDSDGGAVAGADVTVGWLMPAMGAMAEMRGKAEIDEKGDGLYRASLDLPMTGPWTLSVNGRTPASSVIAEYTLNVGTPGLREVAARELGSRQPAGSTTSGSLLATRYPGDVVAALQLSMTRYDDVRQLLAQDSTDGLGLVAQELAQSLASARSALASGSVPGIGSLLEESQRAAASLAKTTNLDTARAAFGELSRSLIAVAASDTRLIEGWQAFSCPMTSTFPKWMQVGDELQNPYMGQSMPGCGEEADWTVPRLESLEEVEAHLEHVHGGADGDEIAHYTCSMHPSVKRDAPGTCPICSMGLVPVTRREVETGVFVVDAARRQEIGVRTEVARVEAVNVTVRAVGRVVYDESRLSEVTVKYKGWVGKLQVDRTGELVERGQVLFELYSPELYATQEELLAALASQRAARGSAAPDRADYLVEAAKQRLRLWDLSDEQIAEVSAGGKPIQYLPVLAPTTGTVIEKHVVEGSTVEPGQTLYRLAGLDRVWIEAEIYEADLPLVEVGQLAEVTLPYLPGRSFEGKVSFVYPYLEGASRTGIVRLTFANPNLDLKPEMYANVLLLAERGDRLTVSEEAVLYAGDRRLVFVDLGDGRLEPRTVKVGIRSGDRVEIVSGLEAGEIVVASGNFLIAAESRLKSATGKW